MRRQRAALTPPHRSGAAIQVPRRSPWQPRDGLEVRGRRPHLLLHPEKELEQFRQEAQRYLT